MRPDNVLNLEYDLAVTNDPSGRWCARSAAFKSFVYGSTREEAAQAFQDAVIKAIMHFDSLDDVAVYLERVGVAWSHGPELESQKVKAEPAMAWEFALPSSGRPELVRQQILIA